MANQDARYFLNGMKFETEGNLLRTVATDGHRLAVCTMALSQELTTHSVIVPRKAVLELSRLVSGNQEPVRLEIGSSNIRVSMNGIVFTSKLIDGRFPDYRRVLPRNADRILEAETEVLKRALMRAAILSNEKFRGVRLALKDNVLKITANNPEQEEAEEIIDVHYQSPEMEVGFNVSYLLDVLNTLKCERVRFNLVDASSSCLIEDCDNSTAEYVIMPMRL
jgi:DNA polymerase III, beta subunit